jgi:hypothetical protein
MGSDIDGDGIGEPVLKRRKPDVGKNYPSEIPQTDDEFNSERLGLQSNPKPHWYSLSQAPGSLRLFAVRNLTQNGNLLSVPNLLLQKFPASSFTVDMKMTFRSLLEGEKSGLVVLGKEWGYLAMVHTDTGTDLCTAVHSPDFAGLIR